MCLICVDYQKGLLTAAEARRNIGEMVISDEHRDEIEIMIEDRELTEQIAKAPARYTFKIDVGSVSPEEAEAFLREAKMRIKSRE